MANAAARQATGSTTEATSADDTQAASAAEHAQQLH
jgi:hypothetical protein